MLMSEEEEVLEVIIPAEDNLPDNNNLAKQIWHEISAGIGVWGTFRPIVAVALAIVPFLYLGQHFNRKHQRGSDFFFLQIPLSFTLILWIALYAWSVFDAWKDSNIIVSKNS
jgi:hypothetical protein